MRAIAIIPARGGSKGLPGKNVRLLCGRPLIAWTIDAAQRAETIERVVVSTDDPRIAAASAACGAEVVQRPPELSGDRAPSEAALLHALDELGVDRGALAFLQCTAPLMLPSDIDGTVRLLERCDTAFTAAPWHRFAWKRGPDGAVPIGHEKSVRLMRQQRLDDFLEVGAVYAMTVEGLKENRSRFFGRTEIYPIDPERSFEIDDETDFLLVEALMRRRLNREKAAQLPEGIEAVVMDFDGVLTDNRVCVDEAGRESVACNRGDGWAIGRLREAGVRSLILTGESNPVVFHRARKLQTECIQAPEGKLDALKEWCHRNEVDPRRCVYVGNDAPDVPCMQFVGCGVAPADAHPPAKSAARIVLDIPGGAGCIRELAALILGDRLG